jgi:hypothetical protein
MIWTRIIGKECLLTKTPPTPKPPSALNTMAKTGVSGFTADSAAPKAAKPCQCKRSIPLLQKPTYGSTYS